MEAFSLFDKDGDGKISSQELSNVYKDLGGAPNAAQIESMIKEADADADGQLNQEEFLEFMRGQMAAASNEDQIIEAFRVMADDVDGTGKVNLSNLRNILTTVGQKLSEEEANMLANDAKPDTADDVVDYKAFVKRMMARP